MNKLVFIGAVILITASLFLAPKNNMENRMFLAPPPYLSYFSFGHQMSIADNLWVRAIQDFDYCEQQIEKKVCQKQGWLYRMLEELTSLAPDYMVAYRDGGMALSVIISDISGASKILDKGLAVIQSDANLYYRAAYHSLFEEKDKKKAADRFLAAAKLQGLKGEWFYNMATRLYDEAGQREVALKIYYDMKEQGLDEAYLERMREKLNIKDGDAN